MKVTFNFNSTNENSTEKLLQRSFKETKQLTKLITVNYSVRIKFTANSALQILFITESMIFRSNGTEKL